jgi:hypothetical protein
MIGYSNIPEEWKKALTTVEDMDFKYTTMSLNDVYMIGTKHALEILGENGAKIKGDEIEIAFQEIVPVALERGFEGHFPVERNPIAKNLNELHKELNIDFTGNGFVLTGSADKTAKEYEDAVAELEMSIDGGATEKILMPTRFATRKHEIAWKYQLTEGPHKVKITLLNPTPGFKVDVGDLIVYSSKKGENKLNAN